MRKFKVTFLSAVLLLLAACGGTTTTTLTVTPESASTTAGGDTVTLTASGAASVTWSLSPELGSLSATSGASVTYTPPERVESRQTVTVTATSASASASATITIDPVLVDVSGVVRGYSGSTAPGVEVLIPGHGKVITDDEGRFSFADVVAPYQIIIRSDATHFTVYDGLTRAEPVLYGYSSGSSYTATLEGTVSGTTSGRRLAIALDSSGALFINTLSTSDTSTAYSAQAYLISPAASGKLHALEFTEDADGNVSAFNGYATYPDTVYLAAGGTFSGLDMSLGPVDDHYVNVNIANLSSSFSVTTLFSGVRFAPPSSPGFRIQTARYSSPADSVNVLIPELDGAYTQITAFISEATSSSPGSGSALPLGIEGVNSQVVLPTVGAVWKSVPTTATRVILDAPKRPELQGPADGAADVSPDTVFSWDADPGAFMQVKFYGPVSINYYTDKTEVQLPDLSEFGVSYNSGDSYTWEVEAINLGDYYDTLDGYASPNSLSPYAFYLSLYFGGNPGSADGYLLISSGRGFTIQ